ncbi:MAG: hypothetical protein AAFV19_16985 [Pseudomonadota bacterium]
MNFANITIPENGVQRSNSWIDAKAISRREKQTRDHVMASLNSIREADGRLIDATEMKLIRDGFIDFPRLARLAYRHTKKYRTRHDLLYFSAKYCRLLHSSIEIGIEAIHDRSKTVAHRGYQLLAKSNSKFLLQTLESRFSELTDDMEKRDCLAAIEAISNQNQHLFIDREFVAGKRRAGRSYMIQEFHHEEEFVSRFGKDWRFLMMEQNAVLEAMSGREVAT